MVCLFFIKFQMVVVIPGGCERDIHFMQAALDSSEEHGDILHLIDYKSDFQAINVRN